MTTHEYLLQKYGTTLTWEQASSETGIYWQTIREMCLRGEIKTLKVGQGLKKSRRILTTKALADYLDASKEDKPKQDKLITKHKKIV